MKVDSLAGLGNDIFWQSKKNRDIQSSNFSRMETLKYYILITLNEKILQVVPPIVVNRASIENEVGWPAFANEKGSS